MAAVYGTLSKFNPQTQSWEDYTEVMGHYFTANEIKEDKKKQAIFLASVGDKIYALIKSLCQPGSPGDKKFDELVALVQEHFTPKPSEIVQRYKFYTRTRQAGETVHQFVAALRNLSKHCNFGSTLNIMMRDRLVVGMDDEKIQRKLLQEPGLTFEKALEIAVAMETTNKNLKELKNPVGPGEEKVNKVFASKTKGQGSGKPDQRKYTSKKGPEGKRCFRCGANHDPNACKYKEETCFNCQKKGHIKTVCRSKKAPACNLIQDNDDDESDVLPMYSAYHIVNAKEPPVEVSVEINSKPLQFEVDTGCPVTLISEETLSNVYEGKVPQLKKSVLRLKSYTGQQLKTLGMVETEIQYQNHTQVVPLTVVEGNGPSLLGRDLIREFSVMKISQRNLTLQDVLSKHEEVFKKGLGTLKGAKAKSHVPEGATPRFFKPRSLPYAMKGKVESEIDRLVGEGILKPVEFSEWAAPIVPVLKPDNTIRLCGDYKVTVNQVSHLEQYPLPSLEDISAKLAGGKKFTKLDMSHAYQQLLLDEESSKYVTINTHRGLFTYSRLPYGVSSAPAIFQRTVESLLRDIPGVAVYMDDIILTGTNDVEHLETLDLVLTKLEESGLRLKQAKCTLLAEEVVYLGHKFDAQGIHPVKDKVQALLETRAPQNVTELKSYLGLLNYYNRFLPNLSTVLTPLHRLLRKATPWQWGEAEQKCFETTKKLITGAGVLVYYNSDQPLILQCDASPYGLGAVLSHRMEDTSDKPIAFASRTLNSAEKNYSQLDKEGASVMFGLKKFHKYLYGRHFTIVTDHKPLVSLFSEKKQVPVTASPRVQRWAVTLRGYEYDIVYKSGHSHGNADALSRLPLPVTTRVEAEESVLLLREVEDFMRQNGIIHKTSAPYHPASNGLAERAVQTVKDGLTKMPGSSVAQKLQLVLFNYRLTPHSTTGRSPAEMLMGRKLRSRLDLLHPNLQSKVHKKQERMKETHDAHAMERQFKEGDKIYLKNFGHGPKWLSGVIQMVTGPVSYTVVTADGREHRRHVDHIRTRYEEQEVSVPEAPPNSDVATGISALASSSHSRQPEGGEIDTIPQPTEGDQPTPYNTDSTQASQDSNDPESTDVEAAEAVAEASAPMQIPTPEQLPRRSDRVRRAPVHLKDFVTGV